MEEKKETLGVTERTLPNESVGMTWGQEGCFIGGWSTGSSPMQAVDEKRGVAGFTTIRYLGGTRQISQGPTRLHSTKVTVRIDSYHPVGTLTVFHGLRR